MSLQIQKSEQPSARTYLEILVIRIGGQWFGMRSDRQIRLLHFEAGQLNQPLEPGLPQFPGLLGELGKARLPILNLAFLLQLPTGPANQLVQITLNGQDFGFAIEQAQAIQRVPLAELRQLPAIIYKSRIKPAVWAVWQRTSEDLIPLLDFDFILDTATGPVSQAEQG